MDTIRRTRLRDARTAAFGALVGVVATTFLMGDDGRARGADLPASAIDVSRAVDALAPNCRMVAKRSLRQSLDVSRRAWLSKREVEMVTVPLARAGSAGCETINDQRFALGEV
jgi:hypothetical protein